MTGNEPNIQTHENFAGILEIHYSYLSFFCFSISFLNFKNTQTCPIHPPFFKIKSPFSRYFNLPIFECHHKSFERKNQKRYWSRNRVLALAESVRKQTVHQANTYSPFQLSFNNYFNGMPCVNTTSKMPNKELPSCYFQHLKQFKFLKAGSRGAA